MEAKDFVGLVGALAWPVTVTVTVALLRVPLSDLIRTVARRATKFSAFKIEVELAKLTQSEALKATVENLRQAVVTASGAGEISTGIVQAGAADYVLISLGTDTNPAWLTSRLFLLAAVLERSRVVRCIVFTGEQGKFVGAAAPRDVRMELGLKYPEYEQAILNAYGSAASKTELTEFRSSSISSGFVKAVVQSFLGPGPIVSERQSTFVSLNNALQPQPPAPAPAGWVSLPSTDEFAEWVTAGGLPLMLHGRLAVGSVRSAAGTASEEMARSIVRASGSFVALVNNAGGFESLCDRNVIIDKIAHSAAEQAVIG